MVNIRTILFLSVLLPWHKVSAQFPSQNYVMSELQLDRVGSRRVSTTKVYDCWGWPVMEVTTGLGSSGRNVYTLQEYNSRGEVEKSWLPVAGSRQVQDISVSDIACLSFLTYSDSKAYTYSAYDALPANKYSSFNFIDGSNEQVEKLRAVRLKKFFFVFYPHTLTFCCNRLTDSNKGCEGKCEGSFFTLTLTLTTSPHAHYSSGRKASCLSRGFNGRQGSSGIPGV